MQRLLNIRGAASNNQFEGNDSALSTDFNWDNISIGNDTLSSNNFFERKHPEHEKNKPKVNIVLEDTGVDSDNMNANNANENYQNGLIKADSVETDENLSQSIDDQLNHIGDLQINNGKSQPKPQQQPQTHNPIKPLGQHNSKVPNVYARVQLDKLKREYRMKAIEQQERDQRKFHAKPAPKFNAIHAAQRQKRAQEEPKITVPITPQVVRSHRHYKEIAETKQKEMMESLKPKPFVSKEPEVLKLPPFVPRPKKKSPTAPAPFNLKSEERLRARHEYDQKVEMEAERKKREEEEKRKAEDENIRRQIRKQTEFKANPNPFSCGKAEYLNESI